MVVKSRKNLSLFLVCVLESADGLKIMPFLAQGMLFL